MTKKLHEAIDYPDVSFPYSMFTVTPDSVTPRGRGFDDLHWHEELQFTLLTAGKIGMRVNGADYIMEAGEAIFINKGALHITRQLVAGSRYVTFNFPEKLLSFYQGSNMESHYVHPFTHSELMSLHLKQDVEWQRGMIRLLQELQQLFGQEKSWGWEYEVSVKTVQLWLAMICNVTLADGEAAKSQRKQQERMQFMVSYIHKNYADPVTLPNIAAAAHLSISECNRSFKQTVNMTAYEYLVHYRLSRSCELLEATEYTITEVTRMVGFNHVNHYIQSFRKHYLMTPLQYRKLKNRRHF